MRLPSGQAVLRAGLPGLIGLVLLHAAAARADCPDWADLETRHGELRVHPPGRVAWRIGHRPLHGQHRETVVGLRWTLDGTETRQTLFSEIQDGTPRLRRSGHRLLLDIEYCERGGECRTAILPYRWDPKRERFAGLNGDARRALEAACAPEDRPGP